MHKLLKDGQNSLIFLKLIGCKQPCQDYCSGGYPASSVSFALRLLRNQF